MFNKTLVTLNIESDSIRFLSIKADCIKSWGSVPLVPRAVQDTRIVDNNAIVSAINGLFDSAQLPKNKVIVSLTGMGSITRIVTLPRLKTNEMSEAVRWAAAREIPIPLEELHLSWRSIDTRGAEQQVFLLGTPRALIAPFYSALIKTGIKLHSIDLKPLALLRIVNRTDAIVIDLEEDSTSIIVKSQGIPDVMHTTIVQQNGTILEDRILELTEDLSRIIWFHGISYPDHPLNPNTPMFLTGKMTDNSGVVEMVIENVGYPIESLTLPVECPPGFSIPYYAVNLGLALRETSLGKRSKNTDVVSNPIDVNILPID